MLDRPARLNPAPGWEHIPWYTFSGDFDADTWSYLDLTALGRQEDWEDSPEGYPQTPRYVWWRWHDAYDAEASREAREASA